MRLSERQYQTLQGGGRLRTRTQPTEQQEQEAVIAWARVAAAQYPCLRFLHHSPNGFARDKAVAVQVKAAGCRPGFPDLILPVPLGGYHGLFIELKADGGRVSGDQEAWLAHLRAHHYLALVCVGAQAAIDAIEHYLGLDA